MRHFKVYSNLRWTIAAFCLALSACDSGPTPSMPAQAWEDIRIQVETRPPLAARGMNEFLVIASREQSKPVHNLVVSLRINEDGRWHQAIQDGHVGVYRRAIAVADPANDVLYVRVDRDNRQGLLRFPLSEQIASVKTSPP